MSPTQLLLGATFLGVLTYTLYSEGFQGYSIQLETSSYNLVNIVKNLALSLRNTQSCLVTNSLCGTLPTISSFPLFWLFAVRRRKNFPVLAGEKILISSIRLILLSFVLYLSPLVLGLGICAYLSTPDFLWSVSLVVENCALSLDTPCI